MQLKRLEAYGFKSFADKITIDFDQGITAIVGPNGSGKSNITDAIRWVLGEQNVRNLRGTKAEDIIFTGSASRKALGVAEVTLVFANDGTLPVDFREVMVTRRLYRSGESEFYINRSRCRLKDIYNLFADTGIGHDGMSIIGQNRIDDILNSRPEERRAFFEETAGITKYRNRKRESVRKLTDTENNLIRVQDIIHEIENQLEP
ncbi:MAG: AAA family ATPase, partial [Selenomonas sp.]|nr:AAA family ATPase [Selenomonas sp.]